MYIVLRERDPRFFILLGVVYLFISKHHRTRKPKGNPSEESSCPGISGSHVNRIDSSFRFMIMQRKDVYGTKVNDIDV